MIVNQRFSCGIKLATVSLVEKFADQWRIAKNWLEQTLYGRVWRNFRRYLDEIGRIRLPRGETKAECKI